MEVEYGSDHWKQLAINKAYKPKELSAELVTGYRKRVIQLRAAPDERTLRMLKSLHFEKLKARPGEYSIRINKQWRLVFRFDESTTPKKVIVIGIEDYH